MAIEGSVQRQDGDWNMKMTEKTRIWLGRGIFLAGILFVIVGIARDEVATVFLKATNICLECIGIG